MPDVSTDLTLLPATFGSHVEVLEVDDLWVRVAEVTDAPAHEWMQMAAEMFALVPGTGAARRPNEGVVSIADGLIAAPRVTD